MPDKLQELQKSRLVKARGPCNFLNTELYVMMLMAKLRVCASNKDWEEKALVVWRVPRELRTYIQYTSNGKPHTFISARQDEGIGQT